MIKLPPEISICDRKFSVRVIRHRKPIPEKCVYGEAFWEKRAIVVHTYTDSTVAQIVDTWVHECREMWMASKRKRLVNEDNDKDYHFNLNHEEFTEECEFIETLVRALAEENGWGYE